MIKGYLKSFSVFSDFSNSEYVISCVFLTDKGVTFGGTMLPCGTNVDYVMELSNDKQIHDLQHGFNGGYKFAFATTSSKFLEAGSEYEVFISDDGVCCICQLN